MKMYEAIKEVLLQNIEAFVKYFTVQKMKEGLFFVWIIAPIPATSICLSIFINGWFTLMWLLLAPWFCFWMQIWAKMATEEKTSSKEEKAE
jgi:hypothetical protein